MIARYLFVWFLFFCEIVFSFNKQFPVIISQYSVYIGDYNEDILHNISLAIQKIDGYIIDDEGIFSFNKVVGKRSAKYGYRDAPVFFNNQRAFLPGGGICVISSTLYAAVLNANLTIIERHKHLFPVHYIPIGLDATVSWGSKDLVFKNTLKQPIMIAAKIIGDRLLILIKAKKDSTVHYRVISEITYIPTYEDNKKLLPAVEAKVYRLKLIDNKIVEKKFLYRDYYPPRYRR